MQSKMWMRPLLGGLATALMVPPASAQQESITVNVSGLRSQKGNVVVCLWKQQEQEFPLCSSTASFKITAVKASAAAVTATFTNVPSGEYAISAFHDENQDGKINRGMMGRPKEGIGFSNLNGTPNKRERPSFDKAKFTVNGAKTIALAFMYP
jgi:uncharacterized protein (DUF2141 family)